MSSNSFDKATREWVQMRKKLYLQIKGEVQRLLSDAGQELLPLEKRYAKELSQPWRSVSKDHVYDSLMDADLILFGDFHALQQSQRGHLRLLRDWPKQSLPVLAVEFLQARHQKWIDAYLRGRISEKEFLVKVSWQHSWGFPWDHYRPLMEWAKKHKVPVFGINWGLKQTKLKSIKTRETFSTLCIRKIRSLFENRQIVIVYGDLHLTKSQLPAAFKKQSALKKLRVRRVFQNFEPLYFQALQRGLEGKLEYINFANGDFCIQSVPPWVKWQSYLFFLENKYDRQINEFEGDLDHTDHVAKLVQFLAMEFKLKNGRDTLAVYTADDTRVYSRIRQAVSVRDWRVIHTWLSEERTFYIPELASGYLGRITVNHTATLAGEYLYSIQSKRKYVHFKGKQDFEAQIWIQAMAYLGSKVINHRRKTNSLDDLRKTLLTGDTNDMNRKVILLAIHQKVREIGFLSSGRLLPIKSTRNGDLVYVDAARLLGAMLGDRIYSLYRAKKLKVGHIQVLLKVSVEDSDFNGLYYKILHGLLRIEKQSAKNQVGLKFWS